MTKSMLMKLAVSLFFLGSCFTIAQAQTFRWNEPSNNNSTAQKKEVSSPAYQAALQEVQTGFATYYADYLAGQPTAYGESYQPEELTASHALLPIGTILRVTRPDNGQAVEVRVNDKGGLCQGCVVVLSRAAAHQIGLTQTGKSKVTVEKIGFSNWNPRPQRLSEQSSSRNAQPVAYQSAAVVYYDPIPRSVATAPRVANAPTEYGVVRPNAVGTNQPDFGPAYRPASATNSSPDPAKDPNAFRPATAATDHRGGNGFVTKGGEADARLGVIQKEVTVNKPSAGPTTYAYSSAAVASPTYSTAAAPLNEVPAANSQRAHYAVQLAAYGNAENAIRQVRSLQAQGIEKVYVASVSRPDGSSLSRVLVGPFADRGSAQISADDIARQKQMGGIVVKLD